MKTDRELLTIGARIAAGELVLDDVTDLTEQDLERLHALAEEQIRLRTEERRIARQILALLREQPDCPTVAECLAHYLRTGQRERYQTLHDLVAELQEVLDERRKWEDLAGDPAA